MRPFLKSPLVLAGVALTALLAIALTYALVGAFLGVTGGPSTEPIGVALTATLLGLLGANFAHGSVEFVAGRQRFDIGAIELYRPELGAGRATLFGAKFVAVAAGSVLAGLVEAWFTAGVLHMALASDTQLAVVTALGVASAALMTLAFLTVFGEPGNLFAVMLLAVYGIPASGGVFPLAALPAFFRWLGSWMPTRFLTDASRVAVLGGRSGTGMGRAIPILCGYVFLWAAIGAMSALLIDVGSRHHRRPPGIRAAEPGALHELSQVRIDLVEDDAAREAAATDSC